MFSTYADLIENISGSGPITQEEYDRMLEKTEDLTEDNAELQSQLRTILEEKEAKILPR